MSKNNFTKISGEYKNARNAVAGLVNAKHFSIEVAKLTDFIAYAIIHPNYKQEEQMEKLSEWGFPLVNYKVEKDINNKMLSEYLEERRKKSLYEVDGIVIIDSSKIYQVSEKNPDYGFAFKMIFMDQVAEVKVIDIEWNVTKHGYLKPVVKIEPVDLVGVTIKNVTAFNARFVVDNNLGPGSIIKIVRSGDVIPNILEVIKPSATGKPKMPDIPYKWNKTNIDIIVQDIHGQASDNIIIRQLTYFFKVMGISFISEGIITKLVQHNYKSVQAILTADLDELSEIEGIGEKLLTKIFKSIKEAFDNTNLQTIMAGSGSFGHGLGTRKLKVIVDAYPNIMNEKWSKKELKDKILLLHGFDEITANLFVAGFDAFKEFFAKLEKIDWLKVSRLKKPQKEIKKGSTFKNQKIVFTGFRNKEWEQFIIDNGGEISSTVSKNTTLLVHAEGETSSSKYIKAKELKITTMTKEEFEKKYI